MTCENQGKRFCNCPDCIADYKAEKKRREREKEEAIRKHNEEILLQAQHKEMGTPIIPTAHDTVLVSFESGHYKKLKGTWIGDSVWTHWLKPDGKGIHINKDKVEYYEEL